MNFYKSMEQIPIYNFWQLCTTGNLKFIQKGEVFDLIDLTDEKEGQLAFYNLIKDNDAANIIRLQVLYYELYNSLYDYYLDKSPKNQQTYNNLFNKYLKELDRHNKNYEYNGKVYLTAIDYYQVYKENFLKEKLFEELLIERIKEFFYNTIKSEKRAKWDIYEEIPVIMEVLGINIDEFTCSAKKYFSLIDRLKLKIEKQK